MRFLLSFLIAFTLPFAAVNASANDAVIYNSLKSQAKLTHRSRYTYTYQKAAGRLVCHQLVSENGVLNTTCRLGAATKAFEDLVIMHTLNMRMHREQAHGFIKDSVQVGRLYCEYVSQIYNTVPRPVHARCILGKL